MTNNSKHGGDRERALEAVTGLAEQYVWKNHGNGARTTLGHATRQHVREAFTAGYEAALTQPPAVEAISMEALISIINDYAPIIRAVQIAEVLDEKFPHGLIITGKDA